jgi:translocation and assembly module TamB
MSPTTTRKWIHWTRRGLLLAIAAAILAVLLLWEGFSQEWLRHELVQQIELGTGTRVEMTGFHFHLWTLRAELDGLTLHGLEDNNLTPLFHADRVYVGVRIISFFEKKFALDELIVEKPQVAVRVEKDGRSNVPSPKPRAANRPWRDTLFTLQIGRLELRDGIVSYNDRRVPLTVAGKDLEFALRYAAAGAGSDTYVGSLSWKQVELAQAHDNTFRFDLSTKFTLHRDAFELDELICWLPHSELNLRAELATFAKPDWNLHYRGRLSLEDIRTIYRAPATPDGIADFSGQAQYKSGDWTGSGHYSGHDIRLPYQWFHAGGMETWGDYEISRKRMTVPNLGVRALGGTVDGRLEMDFRNLAFRTETRLRGDSLSQILAALDNKDFPVHTLHWAGAVNVDSVNTWDKNFQHFESSGHCWWTPAESPAAGMIPASADIPYDYSQDKLRVALQPSQIAMPNAKLEFDGTLGALDSALELKLHADDLLEWDDFINILRGDDEPPVRTGGKIVWRGRILGPLGGPTFVGHLNATQAQYDNLYWDEIDGDLEYSPDDFKLSKTMVRRGRTSMELALALRLDGAWSFIPSSPWTLDARSDHAPTDDLQALFGTNYPATGLLSGDFHGSGTRESPAFDANFVLDDIETRGIQLDKLSGQIHLEHDEFNLSNMELRRGDGVVTGNILYHSIEKVAVFDLKGTGLEIGKIKALQNGALPVTGQLDFNLQGSGPLLAPMARGSARLTHLKTGQDLQGDLTGALNSDGKNLHVSLSSNLPNGKLNGELDIGLTGDEPISGKLVAEKIDMDTFIIAGLHLRQLTGHSSVDGLFTISGALRQPETIEIDANISEISFNYDLVQLQNDGPIRFSYKRNEIRIDQARLHGADTDLSLNGSARFDRDRPLHFTAAGSVNLRILAGMLPDFETQGAAELNVDIQGNMSRPKITGRASVKDASAHYADFPVGLSHLNGDIVFDQSRLLFDRVTAEAGGGQLTLTGNVSYADGPLRYEVTATTPLVRIRYPVGMSWLAGGTIELSGTSDASLLSGHVQVQRVLFAEGVDIASLFAASSETSPDTTSTSPFLRNLSFDVEGQTSPGARIEWASAHVDMEGDVRLRGSWDHPVLLGHVHLLGGEMAFRGNNFQLTRGDINFSNPFRLDPLLNVEATSTISQYQVTIDFSGPASRLALNYRSDPPLPDSDIIALLALGNTGQESALRSSSSSSQNYGATALLSEAISSGLGGRIEHLFGISNFRVDPFLAGTTTESNAAARVTIQKQVTRDLSITYSTNAATTNQYQLIQVEYAVKRDLSVVFLRDINGTYGFDIKFVKHFK